TVGWQENTLVMPDHRGHRLGLALKVATHRQLRERAPQLRSLVTWNSHVNPWMIEINEKLGYEIVYREMVLQGRPSLRFPDTPLRLPHPASVATRFDGTGGGSR